jgi:lipopolysaccharide export system protein LptA
MTLCAAWAATAAPGPPASDQPIHVVSDRLEVDNKAQVANFLGAVKATQGDVSISCDKLEVHYDRQGRPGGEPASGEAGSGLMDSGGKVRKVVALGHVKIRQKDRLAVGRKATYWAGGRKMLLEGKATVWRGRNQVSGEKITLFLDQDRAVVHGKPGKRVAVTIVPGSGKKKSGGVKIIRKKK